MKTGILLMNTGTADEPTVVAVRNYLREFLMDPAIIGAPEFIRKRIVNHIIRRRPERTVANYEEFWTPEGSPFMLTSFKQAKRLEIDLTGQQPEDVVVALGMRYGNPSIMNALHELRVESCDRVVLLPAYPQQVNVCAGTCFNKAREVLDKFAAQFNWRPEVFEVPYFYDNPDYQGALARQVAKHWRYEPGSKLLVSFHSTMLADIEAGDPYRDQTHATARKLAQDLGIDPADMVVCYQSRFDNRKWLQPFAEPTALGFAERGITDICVVCPGFVADNMETSLEVNRDLRRSFLEAAKPGSRFTYVPALNTDAGLIKALSHAVKRALDGGFQPIAASGSTADKHVPGMLNKKRRR